MDPLSRPALWAQRLALPALAALALLLSIAPLGLEPRDVPSPDLVFLLVAAWVIRRPEAAPPLSVFLIGLVADLLRGGPLGIGTLALVLVAEGLGRLGDGLRRGPFLMEWAAVSVLFLGMLGVQCLALWLTFLARPGTGLLFMHAAGTILGYPVMVIALSALFRLRRRGTERSMA